MNEKHSNLAYLKHRIPLFQRYTVPSIASQTDKKFEWLILIHPQTPSELKREFENPYGKLIEIKTDIEVCDVVRHRSEWIATTNLDSDDALSFDFVEKTQEWAIKEKKDKAFVLSWDSGYHFSHRSNQAVSRTSPTNAYNTLIESGFNPLTIVNFSHGHLHDYFDTYHKKDKPMWLQVVHGENVENHKVRHSRKSIDIPFEEVQERFKIKS